MADVAEQFLKGKEPAFVVVGAAHMVGQDGVVRILQKRGYKVEQVPIAPLASARSVSPRISGPPGTRRCGR